MGLKLKQIPTSIYIRYILLNIPGLAAVILILIIIQHWIALPVWLFLSITAFWVVKDMVLFPFVWRAYDSGRSGRSRSMVRGELWRAEIIDDGPPVEMGQPVKIVKMDGLTLFVEPGKPDE